MVARFDYGAEGGGVVLSVKRPSNGGADGDVTFYFSNFSD